MTESQAKEVSKLPKTEDPDFKLVGGFKACCYCATLLLESGKTGVILSEKYYSSNFKQE